MKKFLFAMLLPFCMQAQDDLLSEIDTPSDPTEVSSAFKSLKIVNLESTKLAAKGDFYFIVSHRFGSIKNGIDTFFGLDDANTQIKFLYGINEWLTVHASRSGFQKAYEGAVKYRLMPQQENGFPVTIVGFNSIVVNSELDKDLLPKLTFENRLNYTTQLLISRKFSDRLSLELAPTFFHENFVVNDYQDNSQYAIGAGGRYKISNRVALTMDYAAHLNRAASSLSHNPLSVGVDIETGGHIFQLHFTNSQAMNETGYLGNAYGNWSKGDIFFGFNLVRVF
ncbi:conserved hypothetical protein [Flavobacterium sp. 9AF]|uniref:DUF5777 family beta-barrel protein n=1 Tax=Flavobacterium sp. 9AF TaxID=2653142 RepID=UPI0012F1EE6C|nr:DUF5777 family beta-barrel protein [Flavobacterium sp. 9AF]VXB01987.1 conserved hypothetical protein [Flavobacterium sp. 9AF]